VFCDRAPLAGEERVIAMTPTTMRNIYFRLILLGVWIIATAIVAGTLARSNIDLHSAYPASKYGTVLP
jgi:hypothetical protein